MSATQHGFGLTPATEPAPKRPQAQALAKAAVSTEVVEKEPPKKREAPLWLYVWVGIAFGLAALGIFHLSGLLSH